MKIKDIYQKYTQTYKVSTDTRASEEGSVFFALKGENFNANEFAEKALENGVGFVVVDEKRFYKNEDRYILVNDVLQTLQDLAQYHRRELGIPIIALTGSNGKTTTKELIKEVLVTKYSTIATKGNLNNHIGVPLTLLSMTPETEIGIVEMGANHFGEIALLCEIAQPNYGYITNFGKAHLEGFGSLEGVIKAKSELYHYLKENEGLAFVNGQDSIQLKKTVHQKRHVIATNIQRIDADEFVHVQIDNTKIYSKFLGAYNFFNIATAIGIGQYFDISIKTIKSAIEKYVPDNKRSQLINKKDTIIILDAYNANPTSMLVAITSFISNPAEKKIVILGDMFELGKNADQEHQYIADLAIDSGFDSVVLVGFNFFKTKNLAAVKYKDFDAFSTSFDRSDYKDATLLIKGSRGMALERIVDLFD